jgi:SAM-dependent methyltransferase
VGSVSEQSMFAATGDAYDRFMGRYSRALAAPFADFAGVSRGQRALDVGCGPGALTGELVSRLGADSVAACDPSATFVAACAERHPGVDARVGSAEDLSYPDAGFDVVAAQLVLHFVSDGRRAGEHMRRVTRPGGTVAVCVWEFGHGMQLLRSFWDAAVQLDPEAPDELRNLRYGREGENERWLTTAGLVEVVESTLSVSSAYRDFDELWTGFLAGIGPAGSYCVGLSSAGQAGLRAALFERLGRPDGTFSLDAVARVGRGVRG